MIFRIFTKKIKSEELISSLNNSCDTEKKRKTQLAEIGIFTNDDNIVQMAKMLKKQRAQNIC